MTTLAATIPVGPTGWYQPSPANRQAQHRAAHSGQRGGHDSFVGNILGMLRSSLTSSSILVERRIANVDRQLAAAKVAASVVVIATKSTRELVTELRSSGMPISAMADVVGVQRKTVYSWLNDDGVVADAHNHDRLNAVAGLLRHEPVGSLQFLTRHWERQVSQDGATLKSILAADEIDLDRARTALEALRPAMDRSVKQDGALKRISPSLANGASLTDYLQAVVE